MKRRELLAAGVLRDFCFCSMDELEIYLHALDHRKVIYCVLETFVRTDGTVLCRILQQYNCADLIEI